MRVHRNGCTNVTQRQEVAYLVQIANSKCPVVFIRWKSTSKHFQSYSSK